MGWVRRLWARFLWWIRSFFLQAGSASIDRSDDDRPPQPQPRSHYCVVHLTDDPDEMRPETLYAIGENGHIWHVVLVCPCGCGGMIALNVLPDDSPRWRLEEDADGPTLFPSVRRTTGCRSHFILRRGQVTWCHGRPENDAADGVTPE